MHEPCLSNQAYADKQIQLVCGRMLLKFLHLPYVWLLGSWKTLTHLGFESGVESVLIVCRLQSVSYGYFFGSTGAFW